MNKPLYKRFAMTLNAYQNCRKWDNEAGAEIHHQALFQMLDELPHGSGIDGATSMDFEKSTPNRLIFHIEYHYMNENGFYDGWYNYKIIVTPSLQNDFDVTIVGKDTPSGCKDYLSDVFVEAFAHIDTESN